MSKAFFLLAVFFSSLFGKEVNCDPELKELFETTVQLEEAQKLVAEIQKEGNFSIKINRKLSKNFEGYWSTGQRTVYLTKDKSSAMLTTLIFELHNAKNDHKLARLYSLAAKGKISKKDYVEAVEKVEYENALESIALINLGIQKGIYPQQSRWSVPATFEEHYAIQKKTGHSKWIANGYKDLRRKT